VLPEGLEECQLVFTGVEHIACTVTFSVVIIFIENLQRLRVLMSHYSK
jgi:hypothetical protein